MINHSHIILSLITVFITHYNEVIAGSSQPQVDIASGKVEGKVLKSRNGANYSAFLGIPYGKAGRFEVAVDHPPWSDIYQATEFRAECLQFDTIQKIVVGEEQCLFLNVYTPNLSPKERLPTMIWLHGGGFQFGSSNLCSANYFMDEPVVLVSVNYRLGAFGFLDTQDGVIPGNLGLRDQRLAFLWVQKNIATFGGNPEKVTVFGSSAGSASVALHMLTDTSNLFHGAISESSTALSAWLIQRNPKENALQLGKYLNCPIQPSIKLVECLKSKSSGEILDAVSKSKLGTAVSDVNFLFTPSVESPLVEDRYLKDCPENLMKTVKFPHEVPWMVGFTKNDGIFNVGSILEKNYLIPQMMANWTSISPWLFVYNYDADHSTAEEISNKIKQKFMIPNTERVVDDDNFFKILAQLVGDRWEVSGTVKSMLGLVNKTLVYPFIFSYPGNFSYTNAFFGLKQNHGVGHVDELQYLFEGIYDAPSYNEDSELKTLSQQLVKLWVAFAKTGVPSTNSFQGWLPIEADKPMHFYEIEDPLKGNPSLTKMDEEFNARIKFWEETTPPTCRLPTNAKPKDIGVNVEL